MRLKHTLPLLLKTLYDERFFNNRWKYISQCLLTTVIIFFILITLNVVSNDVVIASIGATTFMVFVSPHRHRTRARYIIGGYCIGVLFGILCQAVAHSELMFHAHLMSEFNDEIFGALAVGLAMFFMVIFNCEHPPAVAVALGLVINDWTVRTIVLTVLALFLILSYRYLFRKVMIDLV